MLQQEMRFQHFEQKDDGPADCFRIVGKPECMVRRRFASEK
jgi:hypothetical protein